MKLLITKHARDMMFERGIEEDFIIRAIIQGAKVRQTEGFLATYGYLRVAYKILNDGTYKIKTVMVHG